MNTLTKFAAIAAVPVLAGGWLAFRPEKLFVDEKVSERAPSATESKTLRRATFASYAHETTGSATLVQAGGGTLVRLTDFKTSNGPDVHVYLVKGEDPKATDAGFLDLGSLKGNVGDQNYPVPSGTDLSQYGSVAIWCKRFNVGFGGASIPAPRLALLDGSAFRLAAYSSEIVVTHGRLGKGEASIVETGGKRFLRVTNAVRGAHVLLVKAEKIASDATVKGSPKIDLGVASAAKIQQFPISKDVDAWLYRSVSLWNGGRSLATAALRSDQERSASIVSTLWV